MKTLFLVWLGGGIGSAMRYFLQWEIRKISMGNFPLGTFFVNIAGCFAIGIIYAIFAKNPKFSADYMVFLTAGVCGGFTTFSAFSLENMFLLKEGSYLLFYLYIILSIGTGLASTVFGFYLGK